MRLAFLRILWILLGSAMAIAVLEAALRLLPVSMGIYRTEQFQRWPLQNSEAHVPYAYSLTWAMLNAHRGTTNNYGHVAPFDYQKDSHPILVLGDSYIESLMNAHSDTLQGQLARKVGTSLPVYGLGASGLAASDYAAVSRMARDEFHPVAAVVLMVDGDFSESLGPHLGYHYLVPDGETLRPDYAPLRGESTLKKVRKWIGDISIYRYLQVNLQFSPGDIVKVFEHDPPEKTVSVRPAENIVLQTKVADWFLAELPESLGLPPECIVFLMDSDRYAIYKPELASRPKDNPQVRQYFIEHARVLGFKISDLDPVFRQAYARDNAKFDHWPIDRHWNQVGHGIGASEAYRLLFSQGQNSHRGCITSITKLR